MCTFPDSEYRFRLCIEQVLISVGLVSGIGCPPLAEHQVVGSEQSAEPVPTDRELLSEVLLTENVKPECCPIFTLWVIIGLYPVGISVLLIRNRHPIFLSKKNTNTLYYDEAISFFDTCCCVFYGDNKRISKTTNRQRGRSHNEADFTKSPEWRQRGFMDKYPMLC